MGVRAAGPGSAAVRAGHREYVFPCVTPYYADPVVMVRGEGMKVWEADGREYLDFFSGILTTAVGHCHPEIVARVQEQLTTLGHTSTLYLTEAQVEMARRLAEIAPGRLQQSFFTNSGTEAIETAIVLACMHTGRSEIIALRYGYSGRSILATNLTAHSAWRPLPPPVPRVKHPPSPQPPPRPLPPPSARPARPATTPAGTRPPATSRSSSSPPPTASPPHSSRRPFRAWAGNSCRLPAISSAWGRSCAVTGPCSSATKCRRGSAAPATTGLASSIGAGSRTSWSWRRGWPAASPWASPSRGPRSPPPGPRRPSRPSAGTRCPWRRGSRPTGGWSRGTFPPAPPPG